MDIDNENNMDYLMNEIQKVKEDLKVNFKISYGDGQDVSYNCGKESNEFEIIDKGCIENKLEPEEMKCYFNDEEIYEENREDIEIEEDKWNNCHDEWNEKVDVECNDFGEIEVISTLKALEGIRIKGLKVNLYKINGVCPELIQSKTTDCDGKVEFKKVPFGSYRIIQIIDKNYFNKPVYVNWNEVLLDKCNKCSTIYVINTVNKNCNK